MASHSNMAGWQASTLMLSCTEPFDSQIPTPASPNHPFYETRGLMPIHGFSLYALYEVGALVDMYANVKNRRRIQASSHDSGHHHRTTPSLTGKKINRVCSDDISKSITEVR